MYAQEEEVLSLLRHLGITFPCSIYSATHYKSRKVVVSFLLIPHRSLFKRERDSSCVHQIMILLPNCLAIEISYIALSKNFCIMPGLYCPVESTNEILGNRHLITWDIRQYSTHLCNNLSYCSISHIIHITRKCKNSFTYNLEYMDGVKIKGDKLCIHSTVI